MVSSYVKPKFRVKFQHLNGTPASFLYEDAAAARRCAKSLATSGQAKAVKVVQLSDVERACYELGLTIPESIASEPAPEVDAFDESRAGGW